MPINITDELHAATTKGKIASAKEVFLTGDTENLQQIGEKTHQLEDSIKNIAATGGASTAAAVTFDNAASGMTAVTAQAAIDELSSKNKAQDTELSKKADVAEVTSQIQTEQKRVDTELGKKANIADVNTKINEEKIRVDGELSKKINTEKIVQKLGYNDDLITSQKALTLTIDEISAISRSKNKMYNYVDSMLMNTALSESGMISMQNINCCIYYISDASFNINSNQKYSYIGFWDKYPNSNDGFIGRFNNETQVPENAKYAVIQYNILPSYIYITNDLSYIQQDDYNYIKNKIEEEHVRKSYFLNDYALYVSTNTGLINSDGICKYIVSSNNNTVIVKYDGKPININKKFSNVGLFGSFPSVGDRGLYAIVNTLENIPSDVKYIVLQFSNILDLSDLSIKTEDTVVRVKDIETTPKEDIIVADNNNVGLSIEDKDRNTILQITKGHLITKNFNSGKIYTNSNYLLHIIVTGQSLAIGTAGVPILAKVDTEKALMFAKVKTMDMGFNFGASLDEYNGNQQLYDNMLYSKVLPLRESIDTDYNSDKWWDKGANFRGETPCSGIVEGILNMHRENGFSDIPFYTLCTASGVGGLPIAEFQDGTDTYYRTSQDIRNAMSVASKMGLAYKPIIVFIQGESDSSRSVEYYKTQFTSMFNSYKELLKYYGIDDNVKIYTYQPYFPQYASQNPALALMELNNEETWIKVCYPIYNLKHSADHIHLLNYSTREMGNGIGYAIAEDLYGEFETLKITECIKDGNTLTCLFNKKITIDKEHLIVNGDIKSPEIELLDKCWGFFPKDTNSNDILESIEKINDTCIKITCSTEPIKLVYGHHIDSENKSMTVGGFIREEKVRKGYQGVSEIHLYMPIMEINNFTSKHVFTVQNKD